VNAVVAMEYIHRPTINWRQILDDLAERGCSPYRVHLILGAGVSTVQNWMKPGAEPGYGYGRALLRLHSMVCGAALTLQRQAEAEK
jgi:hypothetical protein